MVVTLAFDFGPLLIAAATSVKAAAVLAGITAVVLVAAVAAAGLDWRSVPAALAPGVLAAGVMTAAFWYSWGQGRPQANLIEFVVGMARPVALYLAALAAAVLALAGWRGMRHTRMAIGAAGVAAAFTLWVVVVPIGADIFARMAREFETHENPARAS